MYLFIWLFSIPAVPHKLSSSKLKNEIKIAIKLSLLAKNIMTNGLTELRKTSGTGADCAKFNCYRLLPFPSPPLHPIQRSQTNRQAIRQCDKQSTKASTQLTLNSKRAGPLSWLHRACLYIYCLLSLQRFPALSHSSQFVNITGKIEKTPSYHLPFLVGFIYRARKHSCASFSTRNTASNRTNTICRHYVDLYVNRYT